MNRGSFPQGSRGIPALSATFWSGESHAHLPVSFPLCFLLFSSSRHPSSFWSPQNIFPPSGWSTPDSSHFKSCLKKGGAREGLACDNDQESWESVCRMCGLGSWVFTCGCVPSCAIQPSLHPLYPTLPACNVTIHNRCKDTLANCTKVKQKVRWQGGQRAGGEGSECFIYAAFPFIPYPVSLSLPWGQPRPVTIAHRL